MGLLVNGASLKLSVMNSMLLFLFLCLIVIVLGVVGVLAVFILVLGRVDLIIDGFFMDDLLTIGSNCRTMHTLQVACFGGVPERSKGSDCKSDGSAFAGSNPAPTKYVAFCGRSSMVEPQPSKLMVWVRFPSPAS